MGESCRGEEELDRVRGKDEIKIVHWNMGVRGVKAQLK
jgi:hypothetical protein